MRNPEADIDATGAEHRRIPAFVQVKALLDAAGYPVPEGGYAAIVRMLLNEITAGNRIADLCYRDGYRIGREHGYHAGRIDAAIDHPHVPAGKASP